MGERGGGGRGVCRGWWGGDGRGRSETVFVVMACIVLCVEKGGWGEESGGGGGQV